jgi:ubiquinone/menaquinone biosynthesis C-methylase UbiE
VTGVASAYSATGGSWQEGPARIYDRLAEVLVARSPTPLHGCRVLDVGAGTGAASRAVLAAGAAAVVAIDAAYGMLTYEARQRPAAAVGDAGALPFRTSAFDVTVAAFSLNHLVAPADGLREMARVTRSGGAVLVAVYALDDAHPVKAAVDAALAVRGWALPSWYQVVRDNAVPVLATVEGCAEAFDEAGLEGQVEAVCVPFPELGTDDLIAWRLGLAHHAPFVAQLSPDDREAVAADARALLGDASPPLVRSVIVARAITP